MKIEKLLEVVRNHEVVHERTVLKIMEKIMEILVEEDNIVQVSSPCVVCGDIHGQLKDMLTMFEVGGDVSKTQYVLLGDYVDRGLYSLNTFLYLLLLKLKNPSNVVLLRGNHECRQITQIYGFYDEVLRLYDRERVWRRCCMVFDLLPLCAVIDKKVFCVHSGLSPVLSRLDVLRRECRRKELPHEGLMCDIVWNDPEDIEDWNCAPKGAGYLFGKKVVIQFLHLNRLQWMVRSHQLVQKGYKCMFDEKLVTIWSAPNYCYRCENIAGVLKIDGNLGKKVALFEHDEEDHQKANERMRKRPLYFL